MLGFAKLEMERNGIKSRIKEEQRKVDLINRFIKEHDKCSLEYANLFMSWVNHSDLTYFEIIVNIGVDKWLYL